MAAGAADVAEDIADELTGVTRVAEVADAHDQLSADDAGDDGPLDVLDLQQEVRRVRDEVLACGVAEEGGEHLVVQPAGRQRARDVLEAFQRDVGAFHLADQRGIGERVEERKGLEVYAVRVTREE